VDGARAFFIETRRGVEPFLAEIREEQKTQGFRPLPVRERMIPKTGGRQRRLGIATVRDRVVQAALKLVLEPVFEADCVPRGADLPGGVQDLTGLLSQQGLRSWGQPDPGGAGEGGSSPDEAGTRQDCQMAWVRRA
jgi:RNA-directed DNA polymerase